MVSGHSKGFSYEPGDRFTGSGNHAWNAVSLEGRWHLLDSTWGAGNVNSNSSQFTFQYNEFYFLTHPALFIGDHFPLKDEWQLLNPRVSFRQFEKALMKMSGFYSCDLRSINPDSSLIETENGIQFCGLTGHCITAVVQRIAGCCCCAQYRVFVPHFHTLGTDSTAFAYLHTLRYRVCIRFGTDATAFAYASVRTLPRLHTLRYGRYRVCIRFGTAFAYARYGRYRVCIRFGTAFAYARYGRYHVCIRFGTDATAFAYASVPHLHTLRYGRYRISIRFGTDGRYLFLVPRLVHTRSVDTNGTQN
ncbi:UNVERIFIED_CONTAM: hypothetical protein FKN15_036772 [Acipenser sinensis]